MITMTIGQLGGKKSLNGDPLGKILLEDSNHKKISLTYGFFLKDQFPTFKLDLKAIKKIRNFLDDVIKYEEDQVSSDQS